MTTLCLKFNFQLIFTDVLKTAKLVTNLSLVSPTYVVTNIVSNNIVARSEFTGNEDSPTGSETLRAKRESAINLQREMQIYKEAEEFSFDKFR